MAENHSDALTPAQEYMANAIRTYKEAGHDPTVNYFHTWSFSADDEAKLRRSSSVDKSLLIRRSGMDALSITYKTHYFAIGDVQGIAAWITEQEELGRAWTVPEWCVRKQEEVPL
jgi:hypothetical protein